ncbi:uncharacterized protein [Asterias amurensis]|uniref:uncharacterized protein n=1 Tax=Asterias amurensis TaxID=7602 RepID=UPI003AB5ED51
MASSTTQDTVPMCESEEQMPQINEVTLRILAKHLKNWQQLATYLGISDVEVSRVKADFSGSTDEQVFQMLIIWYRNFDPATNRHQMGTELIHALRRVSGTESLISLFQAGNMK